MDELKKAQAEKPYEHCSKCEYAGNKCHVNDKFQRAMEQRKAVNRQYIRRRLGHYV